MAQPKAIAGRLSSFEESEDDCDQRFKKLDAKYRIQFFSEEVLDLSPWYEKERKMGAPKMERVQTQTIPTHGFLLDKPTETGSITYETNETMCEVCFDHSAEYPTSAYQRILQTLSVMQNMDNLLSWFSVDSPEGAHVLQIEPHTKRADGILDSWYLKDKMSEGERNHALFNACRFILLLAPM
ncbi:hypothetical protein M3Y99_01628700 [Aphelenchoides fujianensis]|nr:hypothetical protein M3Y99_01628700 [Aphelenchoides fujianensis]